MNNGDAPKTSLSVAASRAERIHSLTSDSFDLCIIGGGVHGACIAKFAAQAGLSVALLEMSDYASGTSSRSSKMAHGGLRYLEMLDFQQVFEGIRAREQLFEQCPNFVKPYPFLIPVERGNNLLRLKLTVGLFLYDLMVRNSERKHAWIPASDLRTSAFGSRSPDLMGCFRYTDGIMNDSRLVIELIVAAESHGARCLNYARVERIQSFYRDSSEVIWRDILTGREVLSRAKLVINCAGPWAPKLQGVGDPKRATEVRYSRGSHLLFSIPWREPALFLPLEEKGRYYFVWPHPVGTMVGTTEREVQSLESDPQPTRDEIDEVLERLIKDLPESGLTRDTLHYAFAGIRTLPIRSIKKGVSQLSRKHIWSLRAGVLTLLGGKYTTFMWTAREGLREAMSYLGVERDCAGYHAGALEDLPGVMKQSDREQLQRELEQRYGYRGSGVERALERMGRAILRYVDRAEAWSEITPGVLCLELLHAIEVEHAETVEDILRRRLDLEYTPSHGIECLDSIEAILARRQGPVKIAQERRDFMQRMVRLHNLFGKPN